MRRRALLSTAAAAAAGLAGCQGRLPGGRASTTSGTPLPATEGPATAAVGVDDRFPVPESALVRGAPKDAIPAIVDPAFGEDWSDVEVELGSRSGGTRTVEPRLADDDPVIGVVRGGEARAYPLTLLRWHEVVNDDFRGPLLVTYCPLCRTGVTAVRTVDGEATTFGVSGYLWKSNLVMYDESTGSLWSQVAATAIRGAKAGTRLELVTSTLTGWWEWRDAYPGTRVLLPPPASGTVLGKFAVRNYTVNPYGRYADSSEVGLGFRKYDDRLHPKTLVVGVHAGDEARAYPLPAVERAGVVNDRVGGVPVVVTVDAGGALVAYDRRVGGGVLSFSTGPTERVMRGGGSAWRRSTGRALDGPHADTVLRRANDRSPMFWFSWADVFPETSIFGRS